MMIVEGFNYDTESFRGHEDTADIWPVNLTHLSPHIDKLVSFLNPSELETANKYVFKKDYQQYVITRAILRNILSKYTLEPANNISILNGPYKKPFLENHNHIDFNLSHSNELSLIAVVFNAYIGVDIEYCRKIKFYELIHTVFTESEISLLKTLSFEDAKALFYTLWTSKEAFIKAIGMGFNYEPKKISIDAYDPLTPLITELKERDDNPNDWTLAPIDIHENYKACIAFNRTLSNLRRIDAFF